MVVSLLASAAISIAVGIGTQLAVNALTPAQKINTGKLNDLSVPKSSYGATIPQCWGNIKLGGNLLWSTTKREVTRTRRQGGKGGPRVENRDTSYYGSFAVLLAYCPNRPAEKLSRLWLNGKMVVDTDATDPDIVRASTDFLNNHVRFYNGDPLQPVDPLLSSAPPIQGYDYGLPHDPGQRAIALGQLGLPPDLNHIPAYRRKCYLVFENLPLADYNSQIPVVKAEVLFNSNNSLETIVTDICNQAGVTNLDTTGIQNIYVPGFFIDSVTSVSSALKLLQQAYFFDIINSGDTLFFVGEAQARPITPIKQGDFGAHNGINQRKAPFELPKPDPEALPASVEVSFVDQEGSHEIGTVLSRSQVAQSSRKETYNFPIVMSSDRAQAIADSLLHRFYLRAIELNSLSLPPKYSYLEPGDWIGVDFYGERYTLQISEMQLGASRQILLRANVIEAAYQTQVARPNTPINSGGYNPPNPASEVVRLQGNTNLTVMDINLISDRDEDYGVYVAANGGTAWRNASIYVSNDDRSYYFTGTTLSEGTIGTLDSSFDSSSTSVLIQLDSGEFESISNADFDNGVNKLLIGNEIIQFQTAVFNGSQWELSTLRRGLRGTETYSNSHAIGDRVVLLTGNGAVIERIDGSRSDIGQIRYFKAPSDGQTLAAANSIPLTIEGNALKPYAPANLAATKDNVGNITVTWDRRDRHAGDATTYNNLPLSELEEKWEIEVLSNNQSVIRTLESLTNAFAYPTTDQTNDFGGTINSITINIYQISAVIGRGYRASATLTPSLFQPPPLITEIIPNVVAKGQTVKLLGSGFNSVVAVAPNQKLGTNLTLIDDTELTFDLTDNTTVTDFIYLYTQSPIDLANPDYVSSDRLNIFDLDLSEYMKTADYVGSNGLIAPQVVGYAIPDGSNRTLPYTLNPNDIGAELVFVDAVGNLRIPDRSANFVAGWGCVVTAQGTGNLEITRVDGTKSGLVFSGGDTNNNLKNQGVIAISHRGNNIWLIVGALSS